MTETLNTHLEDLVAAVADVARAMPMDRVGKLDPLQACTLVIGELEDVVFEKSDRARSRLAALRDQEDAAASAHTLGQWMGMAEIDAEQFDDALDESKPEWAHTIAVEHHEAIWREEQQRRASLLRVLRKAAGWEEAR